MSTKLIIKPVNLPSKQTEITVDISAIPQLDKDHTLRELIDWCRKYESTIQDINHNVKYT